MLFKYEIKLLRMINKALKMTFLVTILKEKKKCLKKKKQAYTAIGKFI